MVEGGATSAQPPRRPPAHDTQPNHVREAIPRDIEHANDWLKHIDNLSKLHDDLKEEVEKTPETDPLRRRRVETAKRALNAIEQARRLEESYGGEVRTRLQRIKAALGEKKKPIAVQAGSTWAAVAAGPPPNRAAVRIRLDGANEKNAGELLVEAKKVIPGVYVVRQLRSGDVNIMVPD